MNLTKSVKAIYSDAKEFNFFAVLTVISSIGFLVSLPIVYFLTTSRPPVVMLVAFIPTLISAFSYFLLKNFPINEWLELFLRMIIIIVIAVSFFGNFIFMLGIETLGTIAFPMNNSSEYERIMEAYRYFPTNGHDIFPKKIPTEAKNVFFHANPPFLQGGESVQLSFNAPPDLIQTYKKQLLAEAQYTLKIAETHKWEHHYLIPKFIVVTDKVNPEMSVFLHNFLLGHVSYWEEHKKIPDDYMIYILESKLNSNHGLTYGAAISSENDHIIFFFERW